MRLAGLELPVADPDAVEAAYAGTLGIPFDANRRAVVSGPEIRLRTADGDHPVVDLRGERGAPALDLVGLGVGWRRAR